jgi:hypothetical protein
MRMKSPSRGTALAIAGVMLLCVGLVAGIASGKKKQKGKGGKVTVLSSQQHAILDSGAITVEVKGGKKKRLVVEGIEGSNSVPLTGRKKVKAGKSTISVPLSSSGKTALSGCSVDGLRARFVKGKKKGEKKGKKSAGARVTPLDRDLAICSVGSENPTPRPYYGPPIDTSNSDRCDFMDPALCLQPWPNDYFTVADSSTDTGRRLNLNTNSMPANNNGVHADPTDINRADGFSPGNLITVKIPQVETQAAFENTGFVPITNLHRYDDDNQPVVVIDAATGERQPVFAELDANPNHYTPGNTQDVNLIIRPTRNFEEGHRYIVALRSLRDAQNNPVPPPMPFRVYRDRLITQDPAIEGRRSHLESLTSTLQQNGFARSNLYLTWDFTVASEHSLAGRALAVRDDALAQLGETTPGDGVVDGSSPTFQITGVEDDPASLPANTLRQVDGVLTDVPCYLDNGNCQPGGNFNFEGDGDGGRRRSARRHHGRQVPLPGPELRGRGRHAASGCERHLRTRPARGLRTGQRHRGVRQQPREHQQLGLVRDQLGRVLS